MKCNTLKISFLIYIIYYYYLNQYNISINQVTLRSIIFILTICKIKLIMHVTIDFIKKLIFDKSIINYYIIRLIQSIIEI